MTNQFHNKICEIVDIWHEMGITHEKFVTREHSVKSHVNDLLDNMLKEEMKHKLEVEISIENLIVSIPDAVPVD